MNEMIVATVAITLDVMLVLFMIGLALKTVARSWRDDLVRECTRHAPDLQRGVDACQQEVRHLTVKIDHLRERAEQEAKELHRLRDYVIPSS